MSKQKRHEKDSEYWKREVDEIIDTYETPGVRPGGTVIKLNCERADLPFAFDIGGELHYRGRILDPVKKPPQPKLRHFQQDIEGQR